MKFILGMLLCATLNLEAQEKEEKCDYKIEKISAGKYKTKVSGFDSLSRMESCFLGWMNTGTGKPDGELLVYDEQNKKRRLAIYKSGIRTGKHLEWYATGALYSETTWETDLYFTAKTYYKSGKIASSAVNGNRTDAVYTDYFEKGQVKSVSNIAERSERVYFETGQIKSEKLDNAKTYKEWHKNGTLKVTGTLDENGLRRIGKWLYYNAKGKLVRALIYDKDNTGWYGVEQGYSKAIKYEPE